MSVSTPWRLALGPQRPDICLDKALKQLVKDDEPIAVVSAGWQEAEGDIGDIQRLMNNPLHDLGLYQRADALFASDEVLTAAYRERQDQLMELQRMYRLRLRHLTIAAREILTSEGNPVFIAEERRHAISQLRALDRHHLKQVDKINTRFKERYGFSDNPLLADHVAKFKEQLARCNTVLITGGNVVVLINRLTLFGFDSLLQEKNIVGWSAGAMVLCDRIVLFHDRMPQGRREPEVMGRGLGLITDTVLLPDAKRRIRKSETTRNSLLSRRLSPATCLALDNSSQLLFQDGRVRNSERVQHISREGNFARVKAV